MKTAKKLAKLDKTVGKATQSARKTTNGCAKTLSIFVFISGTIATYLTYHWFHNETAIYIVGGISAFLFLGILLFVFIISSAVGFAGDGADKLAKYVARKIREKFLSKFRAKQLADEQLRNWENQIAQSRNDTTKFNSVNIGLSEIAFRENGQTMVGLINDKQELVSYYEVEYDEIEEQFNKELQTNDLIYL